MNYSIYPCIFIKKVTIGFVITTVYVNDLNLIRTPKELIKTIDNFKKEFEMKDLGKTKYCLSLQIEHCSDGVLIHQSTYTKKVVKRFFNPPPPPNPTLVPPWLFGPKVPYLSAIGALMHLANYTRSDIAFSVNLLARYISAQIKRHWNRIKHVLRYLCGTCDMILFYSKTLEPQFFGYADAGYLSDPHKARSQTEYIFTYENTAISWRSIKQTMVATSSNHSEILVIHEAIRECVWLRSMIQHIRKSCGLSSIKDKTTVLYENNTTCIAQVKEDILKVID